MPDNFDPSEETMSTMQDTETKRKGNGSSVLIGTGLAVASLILLPAVAARFGLGSSLTGALRILLMKASHRAVGGSGEGSDTPPAGLSCH